MKRGIFAVLVLACAATTVHADSPRQAFAKAWKGQSVVVKTALYSLVYNDRGMLGNTRSGRREGLLVVTSASGGHFRFDGRHGRDAVVANDPSRLVEAVNAAYLGDALDVRSYRKLEAVAIERFVPGAELVVSDVRVERDLVTLEFGGPGDGEDTMTSLRVKWPMPISASFGERENLERLLRRYVDIKQP